MATPRIHYIEASSNNKNESLSPQSAERPYSSSGSTAEGDRSQEIAGFDKIKSRRYTMDASLTISRLDYIKGFFRPKTMTRKFATGLKFNPVEEPDQESRQKSPFILRVRVLSKEKDDDKHLKSKEAQCILDTGNHQGNMVSKDYLVGVLGYDEAALSPLDAEEKNGGTSASGQSVRPEAAVHLTWYHGKSSRTLYDMRFLVCNSPAYELVIGERSIRKHNLILPPNFMVNANGKTFLVKPSEPNLVDLNGNARSIRNEIKTQKAKLEKAQETNSPAQVEKLEEKIGSLEKEQKVADLELAIYNAKEVKPVDEKELATLQQQLKVAKADLPTEEVTIPTVAKTETSSSKGTHRSFGGLFKRREKESDDS